PLDARGLAGAGDDHRVALPDAARGDRPGIPTKIQVRPIDPLNRKAEWLLPLFVSYVDRLEKADQTRPAGPRHVPGESRNIIAITRRDRDRGYRSKSKPGREGLVIGDDPIERLLAKPYKIDFVDRDHDVTDPEQRANERVPSGLDQSALACVDQ